MTTDRIRHARWFALRAHGDQKYGDQPYVAHLDAVADVVEEFSWADPNHRVVAYLHDVLEDTTVTEAELREEFDDLVVDAVALITDPEGHNRKTRKARLYDQLDRAFLDNPAAWSIAHVVKLADRIANVRQCLTTNPKLLKMYRKEHAEFSRRMRVAGHLAAEMWDELERLQEAA